MSDHKAWYHQPQLCSTLCPEGLATEVALEGLLAGVGAQVHVEVGFLGEGVVAELTDVGPLVPAGSQPLLQPCQLQPLGSAVAPCPMFL